MNSTNLFRSALPLLLLILLTSCGVPSGPSVPAELESTAANGLLEPVQLGNVFFEDQVPSVAVDAAGQRIRYELRDVRNLVVLSGTQNADKERLELRLPKGERGFYRLMVEVLSADTVVETAETTLAVLSRRDFGSVAPEDSIFAAQTHFGQFPELRPEYDPETQSYVTPGVPKNNPELVPLLAYAGVREVRDELPWSAVEPPASETRGLYTFPTSYDRYVSTLEGQSIQLFSILNYGNGLYDTDTEGVGAIPYTDEGRAGFAAYALKLKERYSDQIGGFEVWNEINAGSAPWNRGPCRNSPPLNDYAITCHYNLYKTTYERVKAAYPGTLVTGPAGVTLPYGYLEAIFAKGALDYLDAVTVHPYGYPAAPEFAYGNPAFIGTSLEDRARQLRNLIRQYNGGEDKPIYFSEIGWPTGTATRTVSELGQAKFLTRAYVLSLAAGVEKVFWYDFVNDGTEDDKREQNFGLIHAEADPNGAYTPKPGYVAYSVAARQLTGATFVAKDPAPEGVMNYRFRAPSGDVRVVWLPEDTDVNSASKTVTLEASSALTVTDMVGKTKTYTPVNGKVFLTISGDPVYISGSLSAVSEAPLLRLEPGTPEAPLLLVVDNSAGSSPLHVNFQLEGENRTFPVLARPGEVISQPAVLEGELGLRTVYADVVVQGRLVASLYRSVYITDPATLPFPENTLYGDTFPYPDTRGDSLQGDPPQLDTTGQSATYSGFAPAQFVPSSVPIANDLNDGASGALRLAPPVNAAVTLTLPIPARRFSAEVDLVPFTGDGDGGRNLGLALLSAPDRNFFNSPVAFRVGVGMLQNANLRVQKRGGNQFTTPVSALSGYDPTGWNRLRLEVDLDAGTIAVSFNGTAVDSYTFAGLEDVAYIGLDAAPGGTGGTGYLDTLVVTPLAVTP